MHYKNDAFKVAFSGITLSLVILFQFLERYFDLRMGYVKLNITLVFIIVNFYILGWKWSLILMILRFAIGPLFSDFGYTAIGLWSQTALLVYDSIFLFSLYIFNKIIKNIYFASMLSIFIMICLPWVINAAFITPLFWKLYGFQTSISIEDSIGTYKDANWLFFGIKSYWIGMFTVYGIVNLIKYLVISLLFIPLKKVASHFLKKV